MARAQLGAGDVPFVLDGTECVLRPTLKAAMAISRTNGGIVAAMQAIARMDLAVMNDVIAAGLDLDNEKRKDLPEKTFRTGPQNLVNVTVQFLAILANGGQPPKPGDGEKEGGENPPNG